MGWKHYHTVAPPKKERLVGDLFGIRLLNFNVPNPLTLQHFIFTSIEPIL